MMPTARPYTGEEEIEAVAEVLRSGWLGYGPAAVAFEKAVAERVGAPHVIGVNSGTAALHLAVAALGVGPGDEVIVPSLTFVACPQAILAAGATPVFAEVEPGTLCLDVEDVAARVTPATRAVMPVHYGGQPCDLDAIHALARGHDLVVIEDAAHAFGSTYRGQPIGGLSDATCFSFDPIKTITCGEGGGIAVRDEEVAARLRTMRGLGIDAEAYSRSRAKHFHGQLVVSPGFRYHLSDINAAIGLRQLDRFEFLRDRRRAIYARYVEALRGVEGAALLGVDLAEAVPFHFVVRVLDGRREHVLESLRARGIGAGVHYPPNHLQPAFAGLTAALPLPATELVGAQILTLPLFPAMTDDDVDRVAEAFAEIIGADRAVTSGR
jgi:dTDP-4-amino-4,6-dideoxygalactose transaminase